MGLGADRPPSLNRNTRWSQSPRFWLGPTGRGRGDAAVLASFSIGTVTACGARGNECATAATRFENSAAR